MPIHPTHPTRPTRPTRPGGLCRRCRLCCGDRLWRRRDHGLRQGGRGRVGLAALAVVAGLGLGLGLSACGSSPPPWPYLHLATDEQLPALPATPASTPAGMPPPTAWRLLAPITLPVALDRDAVMVATAPGQWVHWQGLRWSEPLRDALPRLLATELAAARGAPVRVGRGQMPTQTQVPLMPVPVPSALLSPLAPPLPWPPALPLPLHLTVLGWEASLPQAAVLLRAHWQLGQPAAAMASGGGAWPGAQGEVQVRVPWALATPAGLVQAQRAAVRALAQALVADAQADAEAWARQARATARP